MSLKKRHKRAAGNKLIDAVFTGKKTKSILKQLEKNSFRLADLNYVGWFAAKEGRYDVAGAMLEYGAESSFINDGKLCAAAAHSDLDEMRRLIDLGANPFHSNCFALKHALENNQPIAAGFLLDLGASFDQIHPLEVKVLLVNLSQQDDVKFAAVKTFVESSLCEIYKRQVKFEDFNPEDFTPASPEHTPPAP